MALLVELSGEQLDLAANEAWSAATSMTGREARVLWRDGPALVLEARDLTAGDLAGRLGLAHRVSDQALSGDVASAVNLAASVDIGGARTFRVSARRSDLAPTGLDVKALEAEAGDLLRRRTGAAVDLSGPEAEVRVLVSERAFAGLLGGAVDRQAMEARAVRYRPYSKPVSIHPKLARAMVNLSMAPDGGLLADPFCGTGGVLMEAVLIGLRAWGGDVDPRMVAGSRENLSSLGLEAELEVSDVGDLPRRLARREVSAIVTDPPYGRSTTTLREGHGPVIGRLFKAASAALPTGSRLVTCVPDPSLLPDEGSGLAVRSVHPMRVHRSLTRHVAVLERVP